MLRSLLAFAGFLSSVHSLKSSINQPIDQSTKPSINQPIDQSIKFESINVNDRSFDVDWGVGLIDRWVKLSAFASTPMKGWNSYDGWDWSVDEKSIIANIDYLAANLTHYGYKIVTVDYYWYMDMTHKTVYMDENGRLMPDPNRFPSGMGGQGFKQLAAYAHAKGLYFGIHTMRGVNQVAINQKLKVRGLNVSLDEVYDPNAVCPWGVNQPIGNFYSLDLSKPGGQEFHDSLYEQYAEWGVDFIKNDCVYSNFVPDQIAAVAKAIDKSGRQMLYSLSPGTDDPNDSDQINQLVNQYRITGDTWDRWGDLKSHFNSAFKMQKFVGKPNGRYGLPSWPDLDMLPLGYIGEEGVNVPPNRFSNLTLDEQQTLMSLWTIFRSPLHYGGDLQHPDPQSLSFLTNSEALMITDHSTNVTCVQNGAQIAIWRSDSDAKQKDGVSYFSLHNIDDAPQQVSLDLSSVTNDGQQSCTVRDIWARKDVMTNTQKFEITLKPHASGLYKVYQCKPAHAKGKRAQRKLSERFQ